MERETFDCGVCNSTRKELRSTAAGNVCVGGLAHSSLLPHCCIHELGKPAQQSIVQLLALGLLPHPPCLFPPVTRDAKYDAILGLRQTRARGSLTGVGQAPGEFQECQRAIDLRSWTLLSQNVVSDAHLLHLPYSRLQPMKSFLGLKNKAATAVCSLLRNKPIHTRAFRLYLLYHL